MKSLSWLVSNVISNDINQVITSELASSRMRAGVCINAALSSAYEVCPLNCDDGSIFPNVIFMSKYVHDSMTQKYCHDGGARWNFWFNLIKRAKNNQSKLVVDYTDNHLNNSGIVSDFYKIIGPFVDGYVVPSEKMKANLSCYTNKRIWVIPEPIEVKICVPKISIINPDRLNILWFGHNSNLPFLFRMIQGALKNAPPHNLVILSNYLDQSQFAKVAALGHKQATYNYGKWSLELMEKISKKVDVCVIPGDTTDPKKNGVSPGRLLTSLAMGLPTIATPLDSYLPFAKYFVSDVDVLSNFFSNPLSYKERLLEVQDLIQNEYTVSAIGEKWLKVCHDALTI